jgi:hypothetical protein
MFWVNEKELKIDQACFAPVSGRAAYGVQSWAIADVPQDAYDAWLVFLATSNGPNPVRQSPASLAVTASLDSRIAIHVLVVRNAIGTIVGIQPIQRGPLGLTFKMRHRELFALPFDGVSLVGSEPLAARDNDKPFIMRAVLWHLRDVRAIEFNELKRDDPVEREVLDHAHAGRIFYRTEHPGNWTYAHVPASTELHNSSLGKKKLYNLRRQDRLLAEHLGGELELVVIRDVADLGLLIDATRQMTGWSETRLRWAARQAELACREGIACSFVLRCNDRLIGLVRATAWGGKLHVHSMHRDAELDKFSPGTALWQAILHWLIEGGVFTRIIFNYGTPMRGNRAINISEDRSHVLVLRRGVRTSTAIGLHRIFVSGKALISRMRSLRRAAAGAAVPGGDD